MRIGELAALTGTTPRMLRHYEQHGVIVSSRTQNGYRDFDAGQVATVTAAKELIDAGIPVRVVTSLLAIASTRAPVDPHHLDDDALAQVREHWERLCRCIECITQRRDALSRFLDQPPTGT